MSDNGYAIEHKDIVGAIPIWRESVGDTDARFLTVNSHHQCVRGFAILVFHLYDILGSGQGFAQRRGAIITAEVSFGGPLQFGDVGAGLGVERDVIACLYDDVGPRA